MAASHRKNALQSPNVVSSNDLVHAKYNMTLWQKRLFAYAISQLSRDSQTFGWQRIYYADLLAFFDAGGGKKAYDAIRQAPKELEMSIEVPYRDEQGNLRYAFLKLLSGYTLPGDEVERNQYVEIRFNDELRPHLLELRERFMAYSLSNIKRLRSTYSIRIYELLKSHEFRREVELELDYLRDILQLTDSYKLYTDFRRNVIDKAQTDLREHCDICFEYEEIKRGNRVAAILFFIKMNRAALAEPTEPAAKLAEKKAAAAPPPKTEIAADLRETILKTWGISAANLEKMLVAHGASAIEKAARVTSRKLQKGGVESAAAFFAAAVRDGFEDAAEQKAKAKQTFEARAEQVAGLRAELEKLRSEAWKKIYETVQELVERSPEAADRAIESLKSSASPMVRGRFSGIGLGTTLRDLRGDRPSLDLLVDEIIRQNVDVFHNVQAVYKPREHELLDQIWRLGGGR